WLWRLALAFRDLLDRPPRRYRAVLLEDVVFLAFARVFVAMLDQEPVGTVAAVAIMTHPHQHPTAVQLLAIKIEFQVAFLEAGLGIFRIPITAIPELHRAAAILPLRDRAFEVAVIERVVFRLPPAACRAGRAKGRA